jgi:hypothetical protein
MMHRAITSTVVVLALMSLVVAPVLAAFNMLEGTVVAVGDRRLIMQDQDGKAMHNLDVAEGAKITRDGRQARLENLMTGDWAKVQTEKRLSLDAVVVAIDARSSK